MLSALLSRMRIRGCTQGKGADAADKAGAAYKEEGA